VESRKTWKKWRIGRDNSRWNDNIYIRCYVKLWIRLFLKLVTHVGTAATRSKVSRQKFVNNNYLQRYFGNLNSQRSELTCSTHKNETKQPCLQKLQLFRFLGSKMNSCETWYSVLTAEFRLARARTPGLPVVVYVQNVHMHIFKVNNFY
jgi:hypothetical protein